MLTSISVVRARLARRIHHLPESLCAFLLFSAHCQEAVHFFVRTFAASTPFCVPFLIPAPKWKEANAEAEDEPNDYVYILCDCCVISFYMRFLHIRLCAKINFAQLSWLIKMSRFTFIFTCKEIITLNWTCFFHYMNFTFKLKPFEIENASGCFMSESRNERDKLQAHCVLSWHNLSWNPSRSGSRCARGGLAHAPASRSLVSWDRPGKWHTKNRHTITTKINVCFIVAA